MTITRRQMLAGAASLPLLAAMPARAFFGGGRQMGKTAAARVVMGFDPSGPAGDFSASVACERMPDGSIRVLSISLVEPR